MAKNTSDWKKGYNEAVEAIKKALSGQSGSSTSSDGSGSDWQPTLPQELGAGNQPQQPNSGSSGSSGSSGNSNKGQQGQQSDSSESQSRTDPSDQSGTTGKVRAKDCASAGIQQDLNKVPDTAGGIISKETGDKITAQEGYDPSTENKSSVAKKWKDKAMKGARAAKASSEQGSGMGALASKIMDMFAPSKNWRKELKNIVGRCLSEESFRRGYTSGSILASQGRIALTDKQKFDNVDYMMVWIDTSGSMTQEFLVQCLSDAYAIAEQKKPTRMVIVQFDSGVQDIQIFENLLKFKRTFKNITIKGGGGTDVKDCFDLFKTDKRFKNTTAELVMIFTDGYLNQYKRERRNMNNLIWVVVGNSIFSLKYKDAFTRVIHIRKEDIGKK